MATLETIAEQFDEMGLEPAPAILGKCLDLCNAYHINDPVEFVEQWMAFSVSHLNGAEPTIEYLDNLERKELSHRNNKVGTNSGKNNVAKVDSDLIDLNLYGSEFASNDGDDVMDSYICKTPKASKAQSRLQNIATPTSSPTPYSPMSASNKTQSASSGNVVYTFGNSTLVKSTNWTNTDPKKIHINQISQCENNKLLTSTEKYMFDSVPEKCLIIADHFFSTAKDICTKLITDKKHENDANIFDELVHVNIPSQNVVRCIGRICSEHDAKLDLNSTLLIGTDDSKLRKVRLNFNRLNSFALFPGQTVLVQGINPRGDTFYVQEIISERLLKYADVPHLSESLNMMIACGPYTFIDDLAYQPLHDIIVYCKQHKPDVLILLGPFLDADNTCIVNGNLTEVFESYFEKMITGIMDAVGSETQVLVVSSSRDAHSSSVYPTYPYTINRRYPNLTLLPDPCIVNINGMTIGLTSTDIIGHLVESELTRNIGDRIKRAMNYMFHQGSFYPIDPPSIDISLDSELTAQFTNIKAVPNMMIVPSDLNCFIRDINKCLIFNPGRVSDKKAGGTFGRIVVNPPNGETSIFNYVVCQVVKI